MTGAKVAVKLKKARCLSGVSGTPNGTLITRRKATGRLPCACRNKNVNKWKNRLDKFVGLLTRLNQSDICNLQSLQTAEAVGSHISDISSNVASSLVLGQKAYLWQTNLGLFDGILSTVMRSQTGNRFLRKVSVYVQFRESLRLMELLTYSLLFFTGIHFCQHMANGGVISTFGTCPWPLTLFSASYVTHDSGPIVFKYVVLLRKGSLWDRQGEVIKSPWGYRMDVSFKKQGKWTPSVIKY